MIDLIVYLKDPVPGEVKTRLHSRYTPEDAAQLYQAFIQDTCETAASTNADRYFAAYTPAGAESEIENLVPSGWNLTPQVGYDLGARMLGSLRSSISSGAEKAILIGTDIPSLPPEHIHSAISRLEDNDIVLGPTSDGGFYLIGTRIVLPEIFDGVSWSTDQVFEQATEGIRANSLQLSLIPPFTDIDTPQDLDFALRKAPADALKHTRNVVEQLSP